MGKKEENTKNKICGVAKMVSLIIFGVTLISFITFLVINIAIENNVFSIIKDVSLAATVSASFSFSLSVTIEVRNYYANNIYENCSFGDQEHDSFQIKRKM